jgi:hypothetical protein
MYADTNKGFAKNNAARVKGLESARRFGYWAYISGYFC